MAKQTHVIDAVLLTDKQKLLFICESGEEKFGFSVQNFRLKSFTLGCKGHDRNTKMKKRCKGFFNFIFSIKRQVDIIFENFQRCFSAILKLSAQDEILDDEIGPARAKRRKLNNRFVFAIIL